MLQTFDKNLSALYNSIYHKNISSIGKNSIVAEPLAKEGEMRWGVSAVLRGTLPDKVQSTINEARSLIGESHTYYDQGNWHLTVRSLEPYRSFIPVSDARINSYIEVLKRLNRKNLKVIFKGFVSTPSGLLLCGYPQFDLTDLRLSIYNELARQDLVAESPEPTINKIRNTCHASLAIYGGKFADTKSFTAFLNSKKCEDFGFVDNLQMEVVRYVRTENHVELMRLSTFD